MSPNDGGPAFPAPYSNHHDDFGDPLGDGGMSLRDWFAGQALPVMAAPLNGNTPPNEAIAGWAYGLADAMIAARKSHD